MTPLHELIRRLPPGVEFLVVVCGAFGMPIISSILSLSSGGAAAPAGGGGMVFNDAVLIGLVVFELVQAAFLVWFLHVRGWTLEKAGLRITWRGTGLGWLLLLGTYVVAMVAQHLASMALPAQMQAGVERYPVSDPNVNMQLVFIASTVNGMFEEMFVAGYIITALREARGVWTAINVSTVVRLLYHLYQGPIGVVTIVPMGLLYGFVYARTRQLWPLMFAHVLIDIIGLSQLGRWLEGF
ncbi:MAG TPA: CPBP family intramembrane glutamic endopeptidase [Steroidobacteraceae bacterium]|nr:CPBP family intramembrane glutamic endopeptidase [Steroidobacteraceae bacterium]